MDIVPGDTVTSAILLAATALIQVKQKQNSRLLTSPVITVQICHAA